MEEKIRILRNLPVILFILFLVFTEKAWSFNDTGRVYVKGSVMRVKYTKNRQISYVDFDFINTSKSIKKLTLQGASLIRGHSEELLKNACFEYYDRKNIKSVEMLLKPRSKVKVRVSFKPFIIYTGTKYAIKILVNCETIAITAISEIEIMKLGKIDPNKYQNLKN